MNKFALYCGLLALAGAAFFVGEAAASGWVVVASYPAPAPNAWGILALGVFVRIFLT